MDVPIINPNSDYLIDTAILSPSQVAAIVAVVEQYQASESLPASAEDIATWAIERGLWPTLWPDVAPEGNADSRYDAAELIENALRQTTHTDQRGRTVRTWLAAPYDCEGLLEWRWDDIRTASHEHVQAGVDAMAAAIRERQRDCDSLCGQYRDRFGVELPADTEV